MARIDWTRIFVDAPGLRPTASEAFMPMRPTAMAAPNAARPTWRLPIIAFLPAFPCEVRPSIVSGRLAFFLVLADQQREDGGQQHEDEGLDEAHQELHEVERDREQPAEAGDEPPHRLEHGLAGEDVAVETEAQ